MSELTRKDIIQTVGQWVSALALALGVVAAGVGYFLWLVVEVRANQEEVERVQENVWTIQQDVAILKEGMAEVLEWIKAQEEKQAEGSRGE